MFIAFHRLVVSGRQYYRFASTQALQTAICLPLGSGSARVQPSAESVKTSFGGDVSKPPTRVALMQTAFPLCGSAGQFAFEQVQLSIGMLSEPFPGGNPTDRNSTPSSRRHPSATQIGLDSTKQLNVIWFGTSPTRSRKAAHWPNEKQPRSPARIAWRSCRGEVRQDCTEVAC
jgi:hypothetical protein